MRSLDALRVGANDFSVEALAELARIAVGNAVFVQILVVTVLAGLRDQGAALLTDTERRALGHLLIVVAVFIVVVSVGVILQYLIILQGWRIRGLGGIIRRYERRGVILWVSLEGMVTDFGIISEWIAQISPEQVDKNKLLAQNSL